MEGMCELVRLGDIERIYDVKQALAARGVEAEVWATGRESGTMASQAAAHGPHGRTSSTHVGWPTRPAWMPGRTTAATRKAGAAAGHAVGTVSACVRRRALGGRRTGVGLNATPRRPGPFDDSGAVLSWRRSPGSREVGARPALPRNCDRRRTPHTATAPRGGKARPVGRSGKPGHRGPGVTAMNASWEGCGGLSHPKTRLDSSSCWAARAAARAPLPSASPRAARRSPRRRRPRHLPRHLRDQRPGDGGPRGGAPRRRPAAWARWSARSRWRRRCAAPPPRNVRRAGAAPAPRPAGLPARLRHLLGEQPHVRGRRPGRHGARGARQLRQGVHPARGRRGGRGARRRAPSTTCSPPCARPARP